MLTYLLKQEETFSVAENDGLACLNIEIMAHMTNYSSNKFRSSRMEGDVGG